MIFLRVQNVNLKGGELCSLQAWCPLLVEIKLVYFKKHNEWKWLQLPFQNFPGYKYE